MQRCSVLLTMFASLVTLACSLNAEEYPRSSQPTQAKTAGDELRRRAMFGAQLAPVTKEVRERRKLDSDDGVVLEKIFPDTAAAQSEFKAGDVILAIGQTKVRGVSEFLHTIERTRAGDVLAIEFVRDGVKGQNKVTLKEMPREKGDGYDVSYSSVTSQGTRLRTIITRPKTPGRHAAVLLLQGGHHCFSIDNPVGPPFGFTWVARNLAKHGYVTMRVERPGCGDSEGGPLRDLDFETELECNKQALRALKQLDYVDTDNVFLFGHSMGGIMAPLMAVELPVRGIAVYGTMAESWFEGVFGQRRRLALLDGTKADEMDRVILDQARLWYPLLVEKKTPREVREQHAQQGKAVHERWLNQVYEPWVKEDKYVFDRHFTYYHQVASRNLPEAWGKVAATQLDGARHPRVLSMWGTSDWMGTRAASAWVAEVVNRVKPGNGSFVALDAVDHFFLRTATPEKSYGYFKPIKGMPPTEFNRNVIETLHTWLDETAGKAKKG